MSKYLSIVVLAFAAVLVAQQPAPKLKQVPLQPTSPASGSQMYSAYCATCHGTNGKGGGPAAAALKIPPTDLTLLSQKNGGVYPANHVSSVIQFGTENPAAHGSATMPMWGTLLRSLNEGSEDPAPLVQQRVSNLTNYLKTMQK